MKTLCPRCQERHYDKEPTRESWETASYPALSRLDNKTYICPQCGTDEAMRDFAGMPPIPPDCWPICEEDE